MKKFLLSVLAATTLFAACTTESTTDVVSVPVPDVLTVSLEEDTRMQLMDEKTVWNEGDLVSVFYKSNANQKWQFNGVTGDRYGELTRVEAGVASAEMEKVVVVYPYDANYLVTPSTGAIEATLPAEQSYLEGSYGLGSSMMISSGYYRQFTLKNVMGWLKLQLTGDGEKVTKVVFRGNNGEQVAGNVYVDADDATLILSSTEAEAGEATGGTLSFENSVVTELTLNCDGVALGAEATSFYLALPPQEFTNGFTVEIWGQDANGNELKMVKKSEAALTIERNVIQPLEAVAYEGKPTSLTAAFSAVDSTMFPAMHGMPGIYLINVSNEAGDLGQLLFYDNTTPFVALNGEYPVVVGSLGQELEGPCFLADPGYCNFFMGGVNYYPVSGTVNVFSTLAQGSPEDNNAFEFNLVVMDDAGNELPLIGALESNIVGALGYGPSYIDFNLAEWGFNTFEVSYDENSANIVKLTSTTTSGDFVMELSTENGDITEGAYNALSGTLSGYYFDGLDAKEYVFKDGQIIFEKVEGTENSYNLVISSRAGDWVLGDKYKVVIPEEGYYTVTINFPAAAPTALTAAFTTVDSTMFPAMHGMPGIYLINVSNEAGDLGQLLFYDNTTPFVALNGEYPVVVGSLGQELEGPCFLADPGYCNFFMGGVNYYPVSGTVNVYSALAQGSPEDNNALEFNMVVMDDAGNELTLTGDLESNVVGAFGYGPSYVDFNLAEWGFNTFEVSYDENSANIVKLTSTTTSGDFVMELSTENGDITEGAYNALSGTLSGYYFDGLDAKEYVFKDGQIIFEKVEGTENSYNLVISSRAGDWVLGDKYKVVIPEEGYYTVTINFPAPEEPVLCEWGLIGAHQNWSNTALTPLYKVTGIDAEVYVAKNVTLADNGFKFMKNGANWETENGYFGYNSEKGNHLTGWYDQVYDNNLGEHSNNITVSDYSKSYDIYLKVVNTADWGHQLAYTVVEAGTEVAF